MTSARWALVAILTFTGISESAMSWKQVGLAGREVTSLCLAAQDVGWGRLYVGTAGHGVYLQQQDNLVPLRWLGSGPEAMDTLTVNSILAPAGNWLVFAGTNCGLHVYNYAMGLPRWIPITGIPEGEVDAITMTQDRSLFVACGSYIYRAHLDSFAVLWNGAKWDTLKARDILPPGQQAPRFRCLLADPYTDSAVYAGSVFTGTYSSWMGVVRSLDNGSTWAMWNQGFGRNAPDAWCLEACKTFWNSPVTYLTGTDDNVWLRGEKDTAWAIWKSSGLEKKQIRDIQATYYSNSSVARLYAATDSGVYVFDYGTNQIHWDRISNVMAVNALAPDAVSDGDSLYAGTADGLYLYANWPVAVRQNSRQKETVPMVRLANPAAGELCVDISGNGKSNVTLSICDLKGMMQSRFIGLPTGRSVLHHSLVNGVYLVRVEIDGEIFLKRILIF